MSRMAADEGIRRIRLLGNLLLAIGLLLLAVALLGFLAGVFFHTGPFAFSLAPLGILLSAVAAALLLAAWIGEGFCEPRQPPEE